VAARRGAASHATAYRSTRCPPDFPPLKFVRMPFPHALIF
jgi:hypothetical protein